VDWEWG